jgi:hypothetical protein
VIASIMRLGTFYRHCPQGCQTFQTDSECASEVFD